MIPTPLGPALPPHLAAEPTEHFPTSASYELKGHEGPVYAVRFNGQGTYCMSCGKVCAAGGSIGIEFDAPT